MTPQERTEALMQTLDFTWDDLNFNRLGTLSERQQARLDKMFKPQHRMARGSLVFHAISVLALQIVVFIYLAQSGWSFQRMWRLPYGSMLFALLIAMILSTAVVFFMHIPRRQITHATVHMVQGAVHKTPEGIGPDRRTWMNKLGFFVASAFIGGMLVRNLATGRGISTRSEDYMIVTSYQITVGKEKLSILKQWGEPFEDGATYTVYYIMNRAFRFIVAAEAH